jgi:ArsR family transcriptional regulator, zinc-responsive transcriptional repressor
MKSVGYCTRFFSALSNPLRVRMLQRLAEKPATVGALSEMLGSERSLVSHNLALLSKAELVEHTKAGNTRVYTINEAVVPYIFFLLDRVVCSKCSLRGTCIALKEGGLPGMPPVRRTACKACR